MSWREDLVAVLFKDDAIANGAYVALGDASQMTALCSGIMDDVIRRAFTGATKYMNTKSTASTTVGQALISAAIVCVHIDCGSYGGGEPGGIAGVSEKADGAGGYGGRLLNEEANM